MTQRLWAVADPMWNEGNWDEGGVAIPETIRATEMDAKDAFLWMDNLYHGGSPGAAIKGNWDKAFAQGFRMVRVEVAISEVMESTL